MNGQAYIWSRELSPQRLRKIDALGRAWTTLFSEPGDRGHYTRHQWVGDESLTRHTSAFDGIVNGRKTKIHLSVIAAKSWYAREVFLRALARTRARYPDFDAHRFVDGDRVGERRIEFASERHGLSAGHLWTSLWLVVKEEQPAVRETCIVEPCGRWGSPLAAASQYETAPDPDHARITVVRHLDAIADADLTSLQQDFVAGRTPALSAEPVGFDFDAIRDGFLELSNPELVVLNWKDACPRPSEADEALWKAAYRLDAEAVGHALARGARVNQSWDYNGSVLSTVIEGWGDHLAHLTAREEDLARYGGRRPEPIAHAEMLALLRRLLDAGAHPDLHGPDSSPAIVDAALAHDPEIASLLLDYGADSSVDPHWDEGPGGWPAAWDYAHTDGFNIHMEAGAREVYYRMICARSSPLYAIEDEEQDRRDALLPPAQRSWQP